MSKRRFIIDIGDVDISSDPRGRLSGSKRGRPGGGGMGHIDEIMKFDLINKTG